MTKRLLVLVTFLALANTVVAQEPTILKGYGDTAWGQSLAELREILPDGTAQVTDALHSTYTIRGDGAVTQTAYGLVGGQLFSVMLTFELPHRPTVGKDAQGFKIVQDKINRKYFNTDDSRKLILGAGIRIGVKHGTGDGQVEVMYSNAHVYREARKRTLAEQSKQALLEDDRVKAIDEAGIDEVL